MWNLIVTVILVVGSHTILYHLLPYRRLPQNRPSIAFFPKYTWPIDDARLKSGGSVVLFDTGDFSDIAEKLKG